MTAQFNEILENTPVLIGGGVLIVLLLVWLIARLTRRSADAGAERTEAPPARPAPPLAVVPDPALVAEPAFAPASEHEPAALEDSAAIADEPIAAAAPFGASPASLAADVAAPESEPTPSTPLAADELTRMKGVGPKLAERLYALGITSFAQIAALTPEEAAALDAQLGDFQGRIHRDRWTEQAGFLAADDVAGYEAKFGKL